MRAHELTLGRSFGVTFDHGDDFYPALAQFGRDHDIHGGYISSFIAGGDISLVVWHAMSAV